MREVCAAIADEHDLGRRAVRVLLEEVVLDAPHRVEAELVGQARLLERVHVHLALVRGRERPRDGELEEDPELHSPWNSGARFATKAAMPSAASRVAPAAVISAVSRAR